MIPPRATESPMICMSGAAPSGIRLTRNERMREFCGKNESAASTKTTHVMNSTIALSGSRFLKLKIDKRLRIKYSENHDQIKAHQIKTRLKHSRAFPQGVEIIFSKLDQLHHNHQRRVK